MSGAQDSTAPKVTKSRAAAEALARVAEAVRETGAVPNVFFSAFGHVELSLHGQADLGLAQALAYELGAGTVEYDYDQVHCSVWRTRVNNGFDVIVYTAGILHPEQVTS